MIHYIRNTSMMVKTDSTNKLTVENVHNFTVKAS